MAAYDSVLPCVPVYVARTPQYLAALAAVSSFRTKPVVTVTQIGIKNPKIRRLALRLKKSAWFELGR